MKKLFLISLLLISHSLAKSQINRYSGNGAGNTLEKYVPLPLPEMFKAAEAIQDIEIARSKAEIDNYRQFYNSYQYYKISKDEFYLSTIIIDNIFKTDAKIEVRNNRVVSLEAKKTYTAENGLKITSEISKGYTKVFLEINGKLIPIEIFIPRLFSVTPVNYKLKQSDFNIGVYDTPNFATNNQIFEINSSSKVDYIKQAGNGFFEISYAGKVGYIFNLKVEEY